MIKHYRITDQTPLKTKRLRITPMSAKELAALIEQTQDEQKREAYQEMRRLVEDNPDQALWYTLWRATLKKSDEVVAFAAFCGMAEDKTVSLTLENDEAQQEDGYAAEAMRAICDWAFSQEHAYFVQIATDDGDAALEETLREQKFYRIENPQPEQTLWEKERPASSWMAIYMSMGLSLGLVFGMNLFDNMAIGMSIGLAVGIALGISLDSQDKKERKRENEPKKLDVTDEEDTKE